MQAGHMEPAVWQSSSAAVDVPTGLGKYAPEKGGQFGSRPMDVGKVVLSGNQRLLPYALDYLYLTAVKDSRYEPPVWSLFELLSGWDKQTSRIKTKASSVVP